ncbi:uncharacterized protein PV09_05152 [Verruconis gallopava]|uniref:Uncharacterized protein n=1 Tax=Verruconis gallopava TaxID=253628 RepID=A0A0D2AAP9_9PEZI|nr:uncharacterized protein PV09_05152 [Verruconis gallopava]KIW03853.1 hypothetical protein PV09_05152 [Verruconis gallopava]
MELEDTSSNALRSEDAMDVDPQPQDPKPEIRKGPKWQIRTDSLVRPVSSGKANPLATNVSQTIAAINKNSFQASGKWSSTVDNMASARQSIDSSRSKVTSYTIATDKVDSVLGSNVSISTTHASTRRPLGDTSRANHATISLQADTNKSSNSQTTSVDQENKRSSYPPVAVRRQSLINMHSAQQRPRSPTGSIASTTSAVPRPRRPSGTNVSSRLSWIQSLENGSQNPGHEYMLKKLEGGVADKLRRFESQNNQASGSVSRSQSATRSSDAYSIEARRMSKTTTADESFRKKLEEQFQKKKKEDEERERKRASLNNTSRTPQQIIDYAELNDRDREAAINDLMKDGKGLENARALDAQARAVLKTQPRNGTQRSGTIFQNESAKTVSALEQSAINQRKVDVRGAPHKFGDAVPSGPRAQSTVGLLRTLSVQQKPKQTTITKPPRPVSYTAVPVIVDDDYDPFNYASYPSRSSIYSNPPEPPAMTPEIEVSEKEAVPEVESGNEAAESPTTADENSATQAGVVAEAATRPEKDKVRSPTPAASAEMSENKEQEAAKVTEEPSSTPDVKKERDSTPTQTASSWASRFQTQGGSHQAKDVTKTAELALPAPAKTTRVEMADAEIDTAQAVEKEVKPKAKEKPSPAVLASKLPLRGGSQKPAAVLASAAAATDPETSEALVAQEAVPASPTLIDVVKPKKATTEADAKISTAAVAASARPRLEEAKEKDETEKSDAKSADVKSAGTELPKASKPAEEVSTSARPCTPPKHTPASLLLTNGSVKIASPCSSPRSPKEFNAAALPRLGTT